MVNRLLNMERRSVVIRLREEKIKSIRQVMHVMHDHVNTLANKLSLVDLEMEQDDTVSRETLEPRGVLSAVRPAEHSLATFCLSL